jgi:hypothetical protein
MKFGPGADNARTRALYSEDRAPPQAGKDYYGGPIRIVGTTYTEATAGEPMDSSSRAWSGST